MTDLTIEEWLRGLRPSNLEKRTAGLVQIYRERLHGLGREVTTRTAWRHLTGETIPTMDVQRALTRLSRGAVTLKGLERANRNWAKRQAASKPQPPKSRHRRPPARTTEEMQAEARLDHD